MLSRLTQSSTVQVIWTIVAVPLGILLAAILNLVKLPLLSTPDNVLPLSLIGLILLDIILFTIVIQFMRCREQDLDAILLGDNVKSLGIADVAARYKDLSKFEHSLGERFRKRVQNPGFRVTWYIVTICPEEFLNWEMELSNAVEKHGVNVKWVYHAFDSLEKNETIQAQWRLLARPWDEDQIEKAIRRQRAAIDKLNVIVAESRSKISKMEQQEKAHEGGWELYESRVPHFFLAFLSVPPVDPHDKQHTHAPNGTFGFVKPYPIFPLDDENRCGLYLEAPGQVLDQWYHSIVELFETAVKPEYGYLSRK
jgi:hypothetical protein